mgnify:FL=1
MSKAKCGGFIVDEADTSKEDVKKSGKGKKPGTVKRSGNKRTGKR